MDIFFWFESVGVVVVEILPSWGSREFPAPCDPQGRVHWICQLPRRRERFRAVCRYTHKGHAPIDSDSVAVPVLIKHIVKSNNAEEDSSEEGGKLAESA
jgi:hypothetical protein